MDGLIEHVLAPDVVFYDDPEIVDTGVFKGADEFAARVREITESMGHFQYTVEALETSDGYVFAATQVTSTGSSSGVPLAVPQYHILHWQDGRVKEFRSYFDHDQALAAYARLISETPGA